MDGVVKILWRQEEVGSIANFRNDMWYFEGDWLPAKSDHAAKFVEIASKLIPEEVRKFPYKGLLVEVQYNSSPLDTDKMLVLSLKQSDIFMRVVDNELATYVDVGLFSPWQVADNPDFYEEELRREVSLFHPLKRKNIRTVGIRTDQDDVLFELLDGSSRFAVVHLTYRKEHSRKFPVTIFYKDWADFYNRELLPGNTDK